MKLTFHQPLSVPPDAAWPFLTEPEYINRWSSVAVETLDLGDGGEPGTTGATRHIYVPILGSKIYLQELIECCEPPSRIVYRLFPAKVIYLARTFKYQKSEIQLLPQDQGTLLQWQLEIEGVLPGVASSARQLIQAQMEKSLAALAQVAAEASKRSFPLCLLPDESNIVPQLWQQAAAVLAEQRAIADALEAAGDMKCWFARIYSLVTEAELHNCEMGGITHKAWFLRVMCRFHEYYAQNLRRWQGKTPETAEAHWRLAFQTIERGKTNPAALTEGLIKSVQAHIEEDLPRALAEIYLQYYAKYCSYARFRADYLMMSTPFPEIIDRFLDNFPASSVPLYLRLLNPLLPRELQDAIIAKHIYNVALARHLAFERGERLVTLIRAGDRYAQSSQLEGLKFAESLAAEQLRTG